MGKFEITRKRNRKFQFYLKNANGDILLTSEDYTAKHNCIKGIEAIRKNSSTDSKYDRRKLKKQYYFTIKAVNGQIVASSGPYFTPADRDNAIESVKENAPGAEITDLTAK